jgi:hypothetical protein
MGVDGKRSVVHHQLTRSRGTVLVHLNLDHSKECLTSSARAHVRLLFHRLRASAAYIWSSEEVRQAIFSPSPLSDDPPLPELTMLFREKTLDADVSPEAQSALTLAADSQLTLVAPASAASTVLTLSADSALNTTFVDESSGGTARYELNSHGASPNTDLLQDGRVVASVHRGLLGDSIVRGGAKTKAGKWATFFKPKSYAHLPTLTRKGSDRLCSDEAMSPMLFSSGSASYTWIAHRTGEAAVRPLLPIDSSFRIYSSPHQCFRQGTSSDPIA